MTPAELATLNYWRKRFPRQFAQAAHAAGITGFGQTDTTGSTFDSVMGSLTGLLTSYGQYRVASQIADSQTAAKSGVLALPGNTSGAGTTNWILYGGIALVGLVVVAVFMKRRK